MKIFMPEILKVVRYKGDAQEEVFKRFGKPFIKLEKDVVYILPVEYATRLLKVYSNAWEEVKDFNILISDVVKDNKSEIVENINVSKTGKSNKQNKT